VLVFGAAMAACRKEGGMSHVAATSDHIVMAVGSGRGNKKTDTKSFCGNTKT
jgi:hypothetical protein